ncbi:ABC transporter ATP-binding protein [Nonomuraea sp. C10]|uniref:ABC transporter ATP-binding protein n=1 Tax=Nonomuraea sp. C10 TaxID=2600577 RepID=UPI0011CDE8B9|nr:ABC transporter ATP-binding protein [Nonomuraea sp. C10]TXK34427.1 ABC transporter ATP-binding protein [Nonomuraea sp. C10]
MFGIENLTKTFGSGAGRFTAIDGLNLDIQEGELVVLLGQSGCGKTTALRCVAGLESADEGVIRFGDTVVFDSGRGVDVAPEKRELGMVFQSYALWPHRTVRQNISYPLKVRKLTKALKEEKWVEQAADLVDCGPLLDRYPHQLSGGQQQRVALARGLVSRPRLVLMDEPLSNLDALLRVRVRNELHELHQRLGFAGLYVTHDQSEAMALGDRVAVMNKGRIEQIGTPQDVFERPETSYVANFVGITNVLDLVREDGRWRLKAAPDEPVEPASLPDELGAGCQVRFRQSDAVIVPAPTSRSCLRFQATVADSVYVGRSYDVSVSLGDVRLNARADAAVAAGLDRGKPVTVEVPWPACVWFGTDGLRVPVGDLVSS